MPDEVSSGGIEATPEKEPSFEDLLTAEDSPSSDPQTDSPSDDAATAEESQGADAEERQASREPVREPFIPRDRFDEVNTKYKEARERNERYAWAEGLDANAVQTMREWYGRAVHDPRAFAIQIVDELAQNPEHAAYLRSEFARRLGSRTTKAESADQMPEPDVAITDANGTEIGRTYSDKMLAKRDAFLRQQIQSEFDAKYGDRFKAIDAMRQRDEAAQRDAEAQAFGKTFADKLATLPLFDAHKAEIGAYIQAHPPASDTPADVRANAYEAYHAVVGPKLVHSGKTEQEVLAGLQRKAQSSSVNPGAASSSPPKSVESFYDPDIDWG